MSIRLSLVSCQLSVLTSHLVICSPDCVGFHQPSLFQTLLLPLLGVQGGPMPAFDRPQKQVRESPTMAAGLYPTYIIAGRLCCLESPSQHPGGDGPDYGGTGQTLAALLQWPGRGLPPVLLRSYLSIIYYLS